MLEIYCWYKEDKVALYQKQNREEEKYWRVLIPKSNVSGNDDIDEEKDGIDRNEGGDGDKEIIQ